MGLMQEIRCYLEMIVVLSSWYVLSTMAVDYKMQDCNEENYPFGEVFDIVVSGSDDEGIPAFELLDAVVINEAVVLSSSVDGTENGVVDADYVLDWVTNAYSVEGQSILDIEATGSVIGGKWGG